MSESLIQLVNYMNGDNFVIIPSKHKFSGIFDMKSEEYFEERDGRTRFKVKHELYYEEKSGKRLIIYSKSFSCQINEQESYLINNSRKDFEKYSFYEIMNWMIFGLDCIGKLKDSFDNNIDMLSFKTIKESGLNKIKNGK